MMGDHHPEDSATVRARVLAARERAAHRFANCEWSINADVPGPVLRRQYPPSSEAVALLADAIDAGTLSPRGADRVLRLAWTLTDLAGAMTPHMDEVTAALAFRHGGP
jgi:magnesium chelatase family protein